MTTIFYEEEYLGQIYQCSKSIPAHEFERGRQTPEAILFEAYEQVKSEVQMKIKGIRTDVPKIP